MAVGIFSVGQMDCNKKKHYFCFHFDEKTYQEFSSTITVMVFTYSEDYWTSMMGTRRGVTLSALRCNPPPHPQMTRSPKHWLTNKNNLILINLGDDDVLRDVSLLHKLSLSAGASTSCILILLQLSNMHLTMMI